jgi:hypothetical protein
MIRGAFAKMALLCFLVAACLPFELWGQKNSAPADPNVSRNP